MSSSPSPSNQPWEREGKEDRNSSILESPSLRHDFRVISRLQLRPQFFFQLNYENVVKILLLKLFSQK